MRANTRVIPACDIDRLILSFSEKRWLKVARIIADAYASLERRSTKLPRGIANVMDARMAILVRGGKLEAKGNIKRWGYSEVRLPPGQERRPLERVLARDGPAKKKRVEAVE